MAIRDSWMDKYLPKKKETLPPPDTPTPPGGGGPGFVPGPEPVFVPETAAARRASRDSAIVGAGQAAQQFFTPAGAGLPGAPVVPGRPAMNMSWQQPAAPYLPQMMRGVQPAYNPYMPQVMSNGQPQQLMGQPMGVPMATDVVGQPFPKMDPYYYDPPMNTVAQQPYMGPGVPDATDVVYSPPMQDVTGGVPGAPTTEQQQIPGLPEAGNWGTFGTMEAWAAAFEAEHGIAPVLEYDAQGNVVGDVKEYWDSQEFLAQYGRAPTMDEWVTRYYTGSFIRGGRGYGGGGGGGGGGGEAPAVNQFEWDPGLLWWNFGQ